MPFWLFPLELVSCLGGVGSLTVPGCHNINIHIWINMFIYIHNWMNMYINIHIWMNMFIYIHILINTTYFVWLKWNVISNILIIILQSNPLSEQLLAWKSYQGCLSFPLSQGVRESPLLCSWITMHIASTRFPGSGIPLEMRLETMCAEGISSTWYDGTPRTLGRTQGTWYEKPTQNPGENPAEPGNMRTLWRTQNNLARWHRTVGRTQQNLVPWKRILGRT